MALVEAPGRPDRVAALFLLAEAWQRLPTLPNHADMQ